MDENLIIYVQVVVFICCMKSVQVFISKEC